jgi:hypothetical protein
LIFYGLREIGLSEAGMRLCSVAMTALALLLCQVLVLTWIARRDVAAPSLPTRLFSVFIFGLTPLAISQGGALRWYPVFALLITLFVVLYLAPRQEPQRLWSAVALGLAASTDFSAILVALPLMVYRYALERRFRWSFELIYWAITAVAAGIGLCSPSWLFSNATRAVRTVFSGNVLQSIPTNALGFFGGDALGISQTWIVLPTIVIFTLASISEIDRRNPAKPVHLLLLMLVPPAILALAVLSWPLLLDLY